MGAVFEARERKVLFLSSDEAGGGGKSTAGAITAFEVYAHDTAFLVGSTILGAEVWGDPSLTVKQEIPACMVEKFSLWITKPRTSCDITVDWGDGVTESLAELPSAPTTSDGSVLIGHTYTANGKYTVRVTGKDYCRLSHNASGNNTGENRLVCRIMDADLPIADHVNNLASFCSGCKHLLKVAVPGYAPYMSRVTNWSSCFSACSNLLSVTGFGYNFNSDANTGSLFIDCKNMVSTDFVIPAQSDSLTKIFQNCPELTMDIASLIPANGFSAIKITVNSLFYNCAKLTGTVPGGSLWNGAPEWEIVANTSSSGRLMLPFTNCSSAIRAQVPELWGGTASNSLVRTRPAGAIYVTDTATTQAVIPLGGGTHWTFTQPLSGLTFTSVENSHDESVVKFTTGGTFNSDNVDIPASVEIIGNEPSFAADKSYCISVVDNGLVGAERTPGVTV